MKKILRGCAVVLLACAVVLFAVAGYVKEESKPIQVQTGVIIDGEYRQIGSGSMGGSQAASENADWMKAIAVVVCIAGVGALVESVIVKEENPPQY